MLFPDDARDYRRDPKFSAPAIVAVLAAVGSLWIRGFGGILLAIVAILAGVIGMLLAMSSRVRGGVVSMISIVAGLIGIIVGVLSIFF
jgi:hypothetical protein